MITHRSIEPSAESAASFRTFYSGSFNFLLELFNGVAKAMCLNTVNELLSNIRYGMNEYSVQNHLCSIIVSILNVLLSSGLIQLHDIFRLCYQILLLLRVPPFIDVDHIYLNAIVSILDTAGHTPELVLWDKQNHPSCVYMILSCDDQIQMIITKVDNVFLLQNEYILIFF